MYPPTAAGFYDVFGNVWEWTEDHFNGLPGFKTTYLYDDFSSPCFDGRHTLLMVSTRVIEMSSACGEYWHGVIAKFRFHSPTYTY